MIRLKDIRIVCLIFLWCTGWFLKRSCFRKSPYLLFLFLGEDLEETQYVIENNSRKRKAVDEHEDAPQSKRQMVQVGVICMLG